MNQHNTHVAIPGTGLTITRLGLGTGPLGGMYTSVSDQESDELIESAFDNGINFFDTAPFYGLGTAEVRLGRALKKSKKAFVLETKVGRALVPATDTGTTIFEDADPTVKTVFDFSAKAIKRSIEESLNRLQVERIDLVLLHDAENHVDQAIDEAYPVLDEYRRLGKISGVGIGMTHCAASIHIMQKCDLDLVLIAGRYTLLDQEAQNELFPLAIEKKISVLAAGVYNSGILANPISGARYDYAPATPEILAKAVKIQAFLRERNVSLTAAAIQFPLQHPAVTAVIAGARNKAELQENIKDFNSDIPLTVWEDLRSARLIS